MSKSISSLSKPLARQTWPYTSNENVFRVLPQPPISPLGIRITTLRGFLYKIALLLQRKAKPYTAGHDGPFQ